MAIIKNKRENSGGREGEGTCIPGRNENWCTLRKSAWRFQKKKQQKTKSKKLKHRFGIHVQGSTIHR